MPTQNKNINQSYNVSSLLGLLSLLLFTQSCSKTEYEQLKKPYADIQSFTIAGYGTIDSIDAIIAGDSITIYWDDAVPLPEEIKPSIGLASGATVEPQANVSVPFSRNTIYTVTAENGDKRAYRLIPKRNREIPRLQGLQANAFPWLSRTDVVLRGEYFMAAPVDQYKVYMQRLRDGVEFDLEIDPSTITPHQINAKLPAFTMDQDTGKHRIWVDLGGIRTESLELDLYQPGLVREQYTIAFPAGIQTVKPGQTITLQHEIRDDSEGAAARYYQGDNILHIRLGVQPAGPSVALKYHEIAIESKTSSTITFKIPEEFAQYTDYDIRNSQVVYKAYTMAVMWGTYTTALNISSDLPRNSYIKIVPAE